ncbi:hypothetical protein JHK85_015610 [Glycine max]|nr:hypothetical protein JHK87_015151 [Glycine soja]KAG5031628.1 hypothetical protein JHK85_015610 [Glycine max]KHN02142.1 hypothetical protein glysoja_046468 [Glycine soja]
MILVDRARVLIVVLSVVGKIPLGLLFRSVAYNSGKGLEVGVCVKDFLGVASVLTEEMEVYGKSMVAGPANVIFLSSILGQEGPVPGHKCDWKCQNEHVCGNMYRCKLTGLTHICDKNCNQRILYDNHSSLCRASGQIFPLSPAEEQAVRGVRRKLDAENSPSESCGFKRRRGDAQIHPSPFERSFSAVSPICSQVGDGMDMS